MDKRHEEPQRPYEAATQTRREAEIVKASWVKNAPEQRAEQSRDEATSQWWWLAGLAVLLAGFAILFLLKALGGPPPSDGSAADTVPAVETVMVTAEGRSYSITEQGFLRPRAEVDVVAELAGRIEYVSDKLVPGGRFEAGEVLLRLDAREARAQLSQARADLASAEAQLTQATADASRQRRLAEIGATATARAEQADASLAAAKAAVAQGEAQLEIAAERSEDTEVTAPFPATVARETAAEGSYVSPGQVIARLFDNTAAEIPLGLAPADAAAIRRAQSATDGPLIVQVEPTASSATTRILYGEVAEIAQSLDPQARTVQVTVRVADAFDPNGEGEVYAQDFVAAVLPALSPGPLYSAPSAVLRKDSYVWTLAEEGGETTLARVEVSPVRFAGDRVVFASETDLEGVELITTALTEEASGMAVRRAPKQQGQGRSDAASNQTIAP